MVIGREMSVEGIDRFENNRRRMVAMLERLAGGGIGILPSVLDEVRISRTACSSIRTPVMYEPCIVIVAQGIKRGFLGDRMFIYDVRNYLTLTVPLPFECETEVAEDGTFLGVMIRIDLAMVGELVMKMGAGQPTLVQPEATVIETPVDLALSDATVRLLECLDSPVDASVLGPQVIREIHYRVLCGQQGGALQALLLTGGTRVLMHRILHRMHSEYAKPMDIASLANEAGMSVSALHHHFKGLTDTSPLQYLKTVRLHKARMLMVQESVGAAIAAERVGYESPSQFSREFKRLFGASPTEETERMRMRLGIEREEESLAG
jgi:AraC-like DNA-binding protein